MKGHPFTKYSGAWKDLLSLHQLFNYYLSWDCGGSSMVKRATIHTFLLSKQFRI